ncbi:conserved hypothetical protein [Pseudoalteromonas phage H105/1]|uniref:Holliday junction resolvase n=1 Tax=Pseudoalteromonas phage H105/1 TaxID=877240 RepID=UPI0001E439C7|nr:Holliday junction resolvase [Pseudoalteromonas phage H105/1]ADM26664.1 conserved hypothetical protein [Pseudoalteromonas phage H105/1]
MSKIIIGCDPDSHKSGMSFYIGGKLLRLECMTLVSIFFEFESISKQWADDGAELHIENVNGISSNAFSVNKKDSLSVKLKKAEHVGKCKQTQIEIERISEYFGIKVIHHKVSKSWKDSATGKAILADLGWHGQSNEDSRSAAYFGYLGVKQSKLA